MKLRRGEELTWPLTNQLIRDGEVVCLLQQKTPEGIVIERHTLVCLQAKSVIPARPDGLSPGSELLLRAVEDCEIETLNSDSLATEQDLRDALLNALTVNKKHNIEFNAPLGALIRSLCEEASERQDQLLAVHSPLNQNSDNNLFIHLEQAVNGQVLSSEEVNTAINAVDACVMALKRKEYGIDTDLLLRKTIRLAASPEIRLRQMLRLNGFIGREINIINDIKHMDCGDIVAFLSDGSESPVLLLSKQAGYDVWIPDRMIKPQPLDQVQGLVDQVNERAIAVMPTFQDHNLSPIGLFRFAYGRPSYTVRFITSGLILGILLGFLLSIGKEVGAARWIFGFGFTGLATGACIGFLSGGFRIAIAAIVLGTALGLLTPTFNTVITNEALPDRDLGLLLQIAVILIATGATRVILDWTQSQSIIPPQIKGAARTQIAGIQRMLALPVEFFNSYSIGDLQLRFNSLEDIRGEVQKLIDGGLLKLVISSIYILFLLKISVKLTILAFIIAMALLIPRAIIGVQSRPLQHRMQALQGQAQSRNLELVNSVSKLRLAGAETRAARWWAEQFRCTLDLDETLAEKDAVGKLISTILPNLGNLLLYIVITKLLSEAATSPRVSGLNPGELLGFFTAFSVFIGAMASFADLFVGLFEIPILFERIKPILKTRLEIGDTLIELAELQGSIRFESVSYRYKPNLPLALDSINFEIRSGEMLAIVGPSGSGKSTLLRLMLAFEKPEEGVIYYDDQALCNVRPDSMRSQIGTVLQNSALFNGTLLEAIAGGRIITLEEAWEAAELAGLAEDIRQMPMGMQTMIPEGGGTLSGGQRQRVSIARAIARKPRILIFDEATSALDNITQEVVARSLDKLSITRIVIAHRLSTIRNADHILVLHRGKVCQRGDFDNLMREDGLFAEMMERQIA